MNKNLIIISNALKRKGIDSDVIDDVLITGDHTKTIRVIPWKNKVNVTLSRCHYERQKAFTGHIFDAIRFIINSQILQD